MTGRTIQCDVDLCIAVPLVNRLGAAFAEIVFPFPLTVEMPEARDSGDVVIFEAALELALGSQMVPVDVHVPVADLVAAPNGLHVLYAQPVCLEPVEQLERLELEPDANPVGPDPNVPRRTVTVTR